MNPTPDVSAWTGAGCIRMPPTNGGGSYRRFVACRRNHMDCVRWTMRPALRLDGREWGIRRFPRFGVLKPALQWQQGCPGPRHPLHCRRSVGNRTSAACNSACTQLVTEISQGAWGGGELNRRDAALTERKGRDLVIELWQCFDQRRFRDALALLSDDFEANWPNTRERIRGPENFIALNEGYPGAWRCRVQRVEECADTVVAVTEIKNGETSLFAVSFFVVRDGRIVRAQEYFAENGPPPFDRSALVESY